MPKAFGQVPKSLFILQVTDDPVLRQAIEKQMDRIEHVHRFTRAVSVGNPREFLQAEKEDQEMAEACKRLIKNCIICWNYLYLSQKLEEIKDTASREAFLNAVAMARRLPGSASTCSASMTSRTRSCETASEFDPQNWWTKWGAILGVAQSPKIQSIKGDKRNGLSRLVPLLEFNHIGSWYERELRYLASRGFRPDAGARRLMLVS